MSDDSTTIRVAKRGGKLYREIPDGSEVEMPPPPPGREMSDEEIIAAARADPDNPPLNERRGKWQTLPRSWGIRRRLKLTQEEFAEKFQIPVGTVRDWEQGRVEPDQAAKAYLKVIAHNPVLVLEALSAAAPRAPKAAE